MNEIGIPVFVKQKFEWGDFWKIKFLFRKFWAHQDSNLWNEIVSCSKNEFSAFKKKSIETQLEEFKALVLEKDEF